LKNLLFLIIFKNVINSYLDINIENSKINKLREEYEDEMKSLTISIYDDTSFHIDEFGILTPNTKFDELPYKDHKQKYYNRYQILYDQLISDSILYEISYNKHNNTLVVLSKYDKSKIDITLEDLAIKHKGIFIAVRFDSHLKTDIIDKAIGSTFEPINLQVLYQSKDKKIRIYNNIKLDDFKEYLKQLFKIESDISLIVKMNNKNNNLDKHGFDKKSGTFLTLKQLRVNDKDIIFITKQITKSSQNVQNNDDIYEDKINCIIHIEDDPDFLEIVKIRQNKTFEHLVVKIKKSLNIECEIRLRK
jgi:hypothetical protein